MRTLGHHPLRFVFAPASFILSSPCSSGLQPLVLFLSLCYLPVIDMVFAEPPLPHSTKLRGLGLRGLGPSTQYTANEPPRGYRGKTARDTAGSQLSF